MRITMTTLLALVFTFAFAPRARAEFPIVAPPPIVWLDSDCERMRIDAVTRLGLPYASVLAEPKSATSAAALNRAYEQLSAYQSAWMKCRLAEENYVMSWLQSGGQSLPGPAQQAYTEAIAELRTLSPQSLPSVSDPFEASLYSLVESDYRNVLAKLRSQPLLENVERLKDDVRDFAGRELQSARACLIKARTEDDRACYSEIASAGDSFAKSFADKVALYEPEVAKYAAALNALTAQNQSTLAALENYKTVIESNMLAAQWWHSHLALLGRMASTNLSYFYWAYGIARYYYAVGNPWAGLAWYYYSISFLNAYYWLAGVAIPVTHHVLGTIQNYIVQLNQQVASLQSGMMTTLEDIQETKQAIASLILTYTEAQ